MITVEEAKEKLKNTVPILGSEKVVLTKALGLVLAENIYSPIEMPGVDQSAMDGYALHFSDDINQYNLVGEVAAGSSENPKLKIGEAVRIFTGARVPDDANLVAQQEIVTRADSQIKLTEDVKVGKNIRLRGEQIKSGDLALEKGTVLNAGGIGFLAGLGFTELDVFKRPKITVITTGNELIQPGKEILPGQIYESNSLMLVAALNEFGFDAEEVITVADNYEHTKNSIDEALKKSDLVMITGGISVGDYDFVEDALKELAVEELFYKVKQKPGKPLFMGRKENKMIAALPGNPASALTCFYIYVLPTLNHLMGKGFKELQQEEIILNNSVRSNGQRAEFLKAFIEGGKVSALAQQSSAMLMSYAKANALIYLPVGTTSIEAGEIVTVYCIND